VPTAAPAAVSAYVCGLQKLNKGGGRCVRGLVRVLLLLLPLEILIHVHSRSLPCCLQVCPDQAVQRLVLPTPG
jgi:hypothetical protein